MRTLSFSFLAFALCALVLSACVDIGEPESELDQVSLGEEVEELALARCGQVCTPTTPCDTRCLDHENISVTCWDRGVCASGDPDNDGVLTPNDNCRFDYNPDQADCDFDGKGNACDTSQGSYQTTFDQVCKVDEDGFPFYGKIEYYAERRSVDVSSCGGAPRYEIYKRRQNRCVNLTPYACCVSGAADARERALCSSIGHSFCAGS